MDSWKGPLEPPRESLSGAAALLGGHPMLSEAALRARAGGENFPVALAILPAELRDGLMALYAYARLVDQVGDAMPGDRAALLAALEADLDAAFDGDPRHAVLRRLAPFIRRHDLPRDALQRLIQANRCDQQLGQVESWDELCAYCHLSANPVGELVLHLFSQASPASVALSDAVCTALQVLEHCQDVAEDAAVGRCYLPASDLAAQGVPLSDLKAVLASPGLRAVIGLQVDRAAALLDQGTPLVAALDGWARLAVAGFVGGGRATCRALRAPDADPLASPVKPRRRTLLWQALAVLWASRRPVLAAPR